MGETKTAVRPGARGKAPNLRLVAEPTAEERPPPGGRTLTRYVIRYMAGRLERGEVARRSARNLTARLEPLVDSFGTRSIERFGPAAIDRWQRSIGHLSPATRHAYTCTTRMFCEWLTAERIIRRNPMDGMPHVRQPRAVPRALSAEDVGRVLAVVADDNRARAIIALMVGLGLRCAEVAGLEMSDYDRVAATMFIRGKAGHERVLPVPPEVSEVVGRYLAETGVRAGPLIRSRRVPMTPDRLSAKTMSNLVAEWMQAAGIKGRPFDGISAHALRHTAASDVLDREPDLRVVQAMLGHAHLSSTAIYLRRANLGQLREAMSGRRYDVPPDNQASTFPEDGKVDTGIVGKDDNG